MKQVSTKLIMFELVWISLDRLCGTIFFDIECFRKIVSKTGELFEKRAVYLKGYLLE